VSRRRQQLPPAIWYPGAPQWSKEDRWTTDLHNFLTSLTTYLHPSVEHLRRANLAFCHQPDISFQRPSLHLRVLCRCRISNSAIERVFGGGDDDRGHPIQIPPVTAMMSTSLHQYPSGFSHLPAPNMVDHQQHHHHLASQHLGPSPLDTLAHTSQYAALQYHQNRHVFPNGKGIVKTHRSPYATGPIAPRNQRDMLHERSSRSGATSGPVRRRISRACDQCNQLRTKCDGRQRLVFPARNCSMSFGTDGGSCAHCIGTLY